MRKCRYTKDCKNVATWAMQFIGEDKPTLYVLGWHARGFTVNPVCDECKEKEIIRQQGLLEAVEPANNASTPTAGMRRQKSKSKSSASSAKVAGSPSGG